MKKKRLAISLLLSLSMIICPVMAAENSDITIDDINSIIGSQTVTTAGGQADIDLKISSQNGTESLFSATVPLQIPLHMSSDGTILAPTNAEIINNRDTRGIRVTNINVALSDGWSAVAFNDDFSIKENDTKEIALKLRNDELQPDGTFSLNENDWRIGKAESISMPVEVKIPKLTNAVEDIKLATINFTLDWDDLKPKESPSEWFIVENDNTIAGLSLEYINKTVENYTTDLVIPETINGHKITAIQNYAFYNNPDIITSIVIPNSVTSIGHTAFGSNHKLKNVTLPENLEKIGVRCFESSGISSISLPGSLTEIGEYAFMNCQNLSSVNIEYGITEIPESAFRTTNITEISIPGSVKTIAPYAFHDCGSLSKVTFSEGLTSIGRNSISGTIEEIRIPLSVTHIGNVALQNCKKIIFVGRSNLDGVTTGENWNNQKPIYFEP